jgi:hypothetical protein
MWAKRMAKDKTSISSAETSNGRWIIAEFLSFTELDGIVESFEAAGAYCRPLWDRLPTTIVFMSIVAAMILERVKRK